MERQPKRRQRMKRNAHNTKQRPTNILGFRLFPVVHVQLCSAVTFDLEFWKQ
jgi:hypothetical protein